MKLKDYLEKYDIEPKEFARIADVSLQNVYYWMRGKFKPNKFYQKILHKATKGRVTESDWET